MSLGGHLEPLVSILRVGGAYGEPWTWSAVVSFDGPTSVRILSAMRAPTLEEGRVVRRLLRAAGVTTVRIERRRDDGAIHEHTWRLVSGDA